jgi:hypothetical protein
MQRPKIEIGEMRRALPICETRVPVLTPEAFREGFRRGAEAMRRVCEDVVMCGCSADEAAHAVNAALTAGPNSAARWRACHRTVCLALLACEIADLPLPAPEDTA